MQDPWEAAAAKYKGDGGKSAAPQASLWAQSEPPSGTGNGAQGFQSLVDQAAKSEPLDTTSGGKFAKSIANNLGAGATRVMLSPIAHPLDTIKGIVKGVQAAMGDLGAQQEVGESIVRPFVENPGGESVAAIPQIAMVAAGGGEAEGAEGSANPLGKIRPQSSDAIVPPSELHAQRLAQSILPPEGIRPNLLESIRSEAPAVRAYAQRTGNPMNTQAEGLKAAEGVANEGLAHYKTNFSEPFSTVDVRLPEGLSKQLGPKPTLGEVEKRISDINDLTRPVSTSARNAGAELSGQEKLGLEEEGKALRGILYDELSKRTGVPPDEIRNMREGYGGQFALRNALESSQNARLERIGRREQGQETFRFRDLPMRMINTARGGEQAIADRQFSSRIRRFDPAEPSRPLPTIAQQQPEIETIGTGWTKRNPPPAPVEPVNFRPEIMKRGKDIQKQASAVYRPR